MSTIVYLSNQFVQAVEVKGGNAIWVSQEMAPEGSIINGVVTDEETFTEFIKRFFIKNKLPKKDCVLVVSSSQITTRMLELPKAGYTDLNKMIAREFSDNRTDNTLYVYHVMNDNQPGRMQKLLAAAVDKSFVQSYVQLFAQAGIEVVAMEPAIIHFAKRFMDEAVVKKQNCIVQIHDGFEVVSILFVNGRYLFSQRNRILAEESDEALAGEAEELIQGLLQFAGSQKLEKPVSLVLVCGQNQEKLTGMIAASSDFSGVIQIQEYKGKKEQIHMKNASEGKVDYVYVQKDAGCEKYLNFIWKMHEDSEENRKRKQNISMALPAILATALCLVIVAGLGYSYLHGKMQLTILQKEMQSVDTANNTYDLMEANVMRMQKQVDDAEFLWEQLLSYPTINSGLHQKLQKCAGAGVDLQIVSFDRDTGVLTMQATASRANGISDFIDRLQELPELYEVEYQGYTYNKTLDNYSIHVSCTLAEGAGR